MGTWVPRKQPIIDTHGSSGIRDSKALPEGSDLEF